MTAWVEADWPAINGVHAVTTTRYGLGQSQAPYDTFNLGIRNQDAMATVQSNRQTLIDALALPSAPLWLHQTHSTIVIDADIDAGPDEPVGDAAVAHAPHRVLAVLTADCLPAVFVNRENLVIGAAHAGWKGLAAGMLEATVNAMQCNPATTQVWLGPAAGPDAYEVGSDVRDAFLQHATNAADHFIETRPGHWLINMYALARQRLVSVGIQPENIFGGEYCTISDPQRFYSYRRDDVTGRMATLIWIDRT